MRSGRKPILVFGLCLLAGCAEKPVLELQQVEEALAQALDAEADIYAADEYDFALMNLESGAMAIEEQEAEPPWRRDYRAAVDLLDLAYERTSRPVKPRCSPWRTGTVYFGRPRTRCPKPSACFKSPSRPLRGRGPAR